MEILLKSKKNNYLVSIAIGNKIKNDWNKYVKDNWLNYCKKNNIGLILFFDNLVSRTDPHWKKATWQKFLIAEKLVNSNIEVSNICYLDIDILINYLSSPNIFDFHKIEKISVISQKKNLNFDLDVALKQVSFNRNYFYSKRYPLDSAIFMNTKDIFKYHNFKIDKNIVKKNEYFCAGVYMYNVKKYQIFFRNIFYNYTSSSKSITEGDEPIFNYEIQKLGKINNLDYKFQSLWLYEMAIKYPFLYDKKIINEKLILRCIENSLLSNYFLHFAGSWGETEMWKIKNINNKIFKSTRIKKLSEYLNRNVTSKPVGRILPKKKINL